MVNCRQCHYQNREGALVCDQCGQALWEDIPTPHVIRPRTNPLAHQLAYQIEVVGTLWKLVLCPRLLYQTRNDYVNGQLVIGRGDSSMKTSQLSILHENAIELGVSRAHAALIPYHDGVGVQDLGSTNGTFLNEQRLPDRRSYMLADGDILTLGQLALRIILKP